MNTEIMISQNNNIGEEFNVESSAGEIIFDGIARLEIGENGVSSEGAGGKNDLPGRER
jgi:hypothetical protein